MDILVANIDLASYLITTRNHISGLDASLGFGVASAMLQGFGVASMTPLFYRGGGISTPLMLKLSGGGISTPPRVELIGRGISTTTDPIKHKNTKKK